MKKYLITLTCLLFVAAAPLANAQVSLSDIPSPKGGVNSLIDDATNKGRNDLKSGGWLQSKDFNTLVNKSNQAYNLGYYDLAIAGISAALKLSPKNGGLYCNRGLCYMEKGNADKAIDDYNAAIRLHSEQPEQVYINRGNAYVAKKDYDKARMDYAEAIEIKPESATAAVACCLISDTFEKEGDYANEIDWYTKAIQLDKESPKAYNYLAWLLATCPKAEFRNGTKAVEQATKACELSEWKNMSIIDTLAAAYAESGDFDKAVKWESKVLDAYPSNDSIKTRLALYQKHQPYHEPPK